MSGGCYAVRILREARIVAGMVLAEAVDEESAVGRHAGVTECERPSVQHPHQRWPRYTDGLALKVQRRFPRHYVRPWHGDHCCRNCIQNGLILLPLIFLLLLLYFPCSSTLTTGYSTLESYS